MYCSQLHALICWKRLLWFISIHLFCFILFLVSSPIQFVPTPLPQYIICFTLVLFVSVCSYLFMFPPCYPPCISCLYSVHSVPSNFLISFLNMFLFISIWLSSVFSMWVSDHSSALHPPPVGGVLAWSLTLSLSSVHASPGGSTAWVSLKDVHVYLTAPVYTLIKDVSFFSLSVSAV